VTEANANANANAYRHPLPSKCEVNLCMKKRPSAQFADGRSYEQPCEKSFLPILPI